MNVWSWGAPLGLAAFILGMAVVLFVLSWAIKTLASIDSSNNRRNR